jgi:pantetheine-phosphate adenylyltransferase
MKTAVCPGSFDPVTNGHIDIFERAAKVFDEVIVGVFHNPNKEPLFTMEERVEMLKEATAHIKNIRIESFSGLLSDYVRSHDAAIVRGIRSVADFEYEQQRDLLIKHLDSDIETVFLLANKDYSFVSSSGIKEIIKFGGKIKGLVPDIVEIRLLRKSGRLVEI